MLLALPAKNDAFVHRLHGDAAVLERRLVLDRRANLAGDLFIGALDFLLARRGDYLKEVAHLGDSVDRAYGLFGLLLLLGAVHGAMQRYLAIDRIDVDRVGFQTLAGEQREFRLGGDQASVGDAAAAGPASAMVVSNAAAATPSWVMRVLFRAFIARTPL